MTRRKRSPQEDKVLSYAKDGRNTYGENDKSSRKAIRFRKRWVNGTYRSQVHDALGSAARDPDEIADAVNAVQRRRWRKAPDTPLGSVVDGKVRARRGGEDGESPVRDRLRKQARRRSPRN